MRSRTVSPAQNDSMLLFALACAAAAAFVGQLVFGTHPSYFLPVGICALPYAAGRNRGTAYRLAATAALLAFMLVIGLRQGSIFLPSLAALALSTYRSATASTVPAARRRR